jgi:hypothetical protein
VLALGLSQAGAERRLGRGFFDRFACNRITRAVTEPSCTCVTDVAGAGRSQGMRQRRP